MERSEKGDKDLTDKVTGVKAIANYLGTPLKRCMTCSRLFVPKHCKNCGDMVDAFCMSCHNRIDKKYHIYGVKHGTR